MSKEIVKLYYSSSEVCKILNKSTSWVRFYGKHLKVKSTKNKRFYKEEDVVKLIQIKHLSTILNSKTLINYAKRNVDIAYIKKVIEETISDSYTTI